VTAALVVGRLVPVQGPPETQETRALHGAAEAWQEDQVRRGGRALAATRTVVPVLRGMLVDPRIPQPWREKVEACVQTLEDALVGGGQ
jgi:hypothetical protein